MDEEKCQKNRWNYWPMCLILFTGLLLGAHAITSPELDNLCADNNSLLKRIDGLWQCYNESVPVYGEFDGTNITVDIAVNDIYYNITGMDIGHVSNINFSNSTFIILVNGTYMVTSQFSFSDGANTEYHLKIAVNGVGQEHCYTRRKLSTGGDVGSASFTCIDNFSVGDEVTLQIENQDNVNDPLIETINFNMHMLSNSDLGYTEMDPIWQSEKLSYVPYTGATQSVNLGNYALDASDVTIQVADDAKTKHVLMEDASNNPIIVVDAQGNINVTNTIQQDLKMILKNTVGEAGSDSASYQVWGQNWAKYTGHNNAGTQLFNMGYDSNLGSVAVIGYGGGAPIRMNSAHQTFISGDTHDFLGRLTVKGRTSTPTTPVLVAKSATGNTANVLEVRNATNSILVNVPAEGNLIIREGDALSMSPINIEIGSSSNTCATGSICMGQSTDITGTNAVGLGYLALINQSFGIILGPFSKVGSQGGTAIGFQSFALNAVGETGLPQPNLAVGTSALTYGPWSFSLGVNSRAYGTGLISIGMATTGNESNMSQVTNAITLNAATNSQMYYNYKTNSISFAVNASEKALIHEDTTYLFGNLAVGSNTNENLTDGDINASILYVDAITYKSPAFVCSDSWCKIDFPQYQDSLYLEFVKDTWTITQVVWKDVSYTPQEFNQGPCNQNTKSRAICDKLIEKIQQLKDKKAKDIERKECLAQGAYYYYDGECTYDAAKAQKNLEVKEQLKCKLQGLFYNYTNGVCVHDTEAELAYIQEQLKIDCEKTGYSVYVDGQCYINEFLKCNSDGNIWDYDLNSCREYIEQIDVFTTPEDCYTDITKKWNGTHCVGVDE